MLSSRIEKHAIKALEIEFQKWWACYSCRIYLTIVLRFRKKAVRSTSTTLGHPWQKKMVINNAENSSSAFRSNLTTEEWVELYVFSKREPVWCCQDNNAALQTFACIFLRSIFIWGSVRFALCGRMRNVECVPAGRHVRTGLCLWMFGYYTVPDTYMIIWFEYNNRCGCVKFST